MISLIFSNQTKPLSTTPRRDPVDVFENSLTQQIDACKLAQQGEAYILKRRRYNGGKEHYLDVPLRLWWWQHEGQYYVTLKYSSQTVAINGHKSIVAGTSLSDVEAVLTAVLNAIEIDDADVVDAIHDAYERTRWKKMQ
ncbi:hypothetical protein GCM10011332_32770 [Terasakiella brassicae]|uniref:Uncharacterized protein n=1 Tax=Terasakiella brassicae TaxID=1634917 RepID=A0A917C7P1_9PROT|nr:hypothetical protein [Terasakiella brassicae]GGF76253.1 hypothetical protein GCM10011332_32770 [Terasakiella brassicae]